MLTAPRRCDAVHAVIASLDPCVGFTLNFREFHDA
ncbi:bsr1729 [Bradyrhizobium diazoefficiens USDA 110]|uniref:Bsr1729 protein n=1 Tax=Bradyrhizobium diazoefficiens (strain JCM 10833 / BCRC 13528 / IAM 13628 / NBRC 14792 / USDA 110) TaxID=224911 RepID=Q89TS0_BRADU|nr:bsr1729 [Bradyrhizobium diazoefficiens USDA 110]